MSNRPYKILHVIDNLGVGGAQTFLLSLVSQWPHQEDDIHIIGLGAKNHLLPSFGSVEGVTVHPPPSGPLGLSNVIEARRLMCTGGFDVVHCHLSRSTALALLSRLPQNESLILHEQGDPALRSRPYHWVTRLGWKKSSAVIANASAVADALAKHAGVPRSHIRVIPNGICLESFKQPDGSATALREELGIPAGAHVIGFAGRLAEQKGVPFLIEALARVRKHHEDAVAVFVGDGPMRATLEAQASALNLERMIRFVGYQTDVPRWAATFDIGVVPSLWEPFGIAAIELMAAGVPVVASNLDGLGENIEDGETGLLVPPRDAHALAEAILRLIESPELRQRLAEAAERQVQAFDIKRVAERIRELYVDVRR